MTTDPVLVVDDLKMHYATQAGVVRAVDGVSFSVGRGQSLGDCWRVWLWKIVDRNDLAEIAPRQR